MSIANRLVDARLLYDAGRYEGALLSVLTAVSGSSRKRFLRGTKSRRQASKEMGDGEPFETFLGDQIRRVGACGVMFGGECSPAGRIFYQWHRCSLAHEAELPEQIVFRAGGSNCRAAIHVCAGPPERLVITHSIVLLIGYVVATASENSDVPEEVRGAMAPCRGAGPSSA